MEENHQIWKDKYCFMHLLQQDIQKELSISIELPIQDAYRNSLPTCRDFYTTNER